MQTIPTTAMSRWMLACLLAAATAGCTMDKTKAPALAGPSEFGLSIDLSVDKDSLPRDGASATEVHVIARGPDGKVRAGERFRLSLSPTNGGLLSEEEVVTRDNGVATVLFIAPEATLPIQRVTIGASPIGGNNDNSRTQTITISLRGAAAPTLTDFLVSPAEPTQFGVVTFDASNAQLDGQPCRSRCTFAWTFGSEGTAVGETVTHKFEKQGIQMVTLVITGVDGVTTTLRKAVTVKAAEGPTATIVASTSAPLPGANVRFTGATSVAKGGATISDYAWDFGNGDTASGVSATTSFEVGTYVVVLTVTDSNGLKHSATVVVTVAEPEP